MDIRIAGIIPESVVDGEGVRMAIFVQGCPHHCKGCHNQETHAFDGGTVMDTQDIIEQIRDNILVDGITITGGEPFCQAAACGEIAKAAKSMGKTVWTYTGYRWRQLKGLKDFDKLLFSTDVLVDGKFWITQKTLDKPFVGSRNQKVLDVRKSIMAHTARVYKLMY